MSVGFDWHPVTKKLWFTNNGRDLLGDNLPPDTLNYVSAPGANFGFPYFDNINLPNPAYNKLHPQFDFTAPAFNLPAHVAPLGMKFYTGNMFPSQYHHQIFLAEHGSWNRSTKIGYQVISVTLSGDKVIAAQPFITGWLQNDSNWGRPVDILVMKDGSLLVSDDYAGVIYRVSY
jgi:glucose/arabinose dehydrogenase